MRGAQLPDKIGRLIPLLSSEQDGEVVATVRAIERLLRAAGQDWHDVAAALRQPAPFAGFNLDEALREAMRKADEAFRSGEARRRKADDELRRSMNAARAEAARYAKPERPKVPKDALKRFNWCASQAERLSDEDRDFLRSIWPHSKSRSLTLKPDQRRRLDAIVAQLERLEEAAA